MIRLELDKKRFKEMLVQFIGDAPFQVELVQTILDQMPPQVRDTLIEELYFKYLFKGEVYIAQHCVFKDDIHYFPNINSLREFLKTRNLELTEEFIDTIDDKLINKSTRMKQPICGYDLKKGSI